MKDHNYHYMTHMDLWYGSDHRWKIRLLYLIALWSNNKNENINHENCHGSGWWPKNKKINERMIMFCFNIFVMKWFDQGFIDYSYILIRSTSVRWQSELSHHRGPCQSRGIPNRDEEVVRESLASAYSTSIVS